MRSGEKPTQVGTAVGNEVAVGAEMSLCSCSSCRFVCHEMRPFLIQYKENIHLF
jgi:hypothetical protein